jgi:sulfatase maturation enzyme AslB (radical SAM superfamily)
MFARVLDNIARLTQAGVSVGYKYLLHRLNIQETYKAARLAKSLGCRYFHARPVWLSNTPFTEREIDEAWSQVDFARKSLDEPGTFMVLGVKHKFTPDWKADIPFTNCRVTPLGGLVFGADGNAWLCCDNRGEEGFCLGSWHEVMEKWGSQEHVEMMRAIDTAKCPRCTYKEYGVILEEVFENDAMNYHFI